MVEVLDIVRGRNRFCLFMDSKTTEKKRVLWLDAVRGLAFLPVIYVHIPHLSGIGLSSFFTPFYLTIFFFVSGYLFKRNTPFLTVLEQRTRTLFIPQLLFGLFIVLLQQIYTAQSDVMPFGEYVLQLFLHYLPNGENHGLWFVAALYSFSLVFYWVLKWCKKWQVLLLVSTSFFVLNCLYEYYWHGPAMPWYLNRVGYGVFYMSLGVLYKEKLEECLDRYMNQAMLWGALLVYVSLIFVFRMNYSYNGSEYIVDAMLITLLGILLTVYLSKYYLEKIACLNYIGANTLCYFGFHHKIIVVVTMVVLMISAKIGITHSGSVDEIFRIVITAIVAILTAIPTYIVNRWFPWVIGKGYKLWNNTK